MKIRLLVDAHVFDGTYQGTTTYLKGLYSALVDDTDFEITLAATDTDNLSKHFPDPRFHLIRLPSGSKIRRLAFDIPQIIKEQRFDFAHFQYITPLKKACKYINTIHDLLFLDFPEYFPLSYRFIKGNMFRFSAKNSDIICTVSGYSKNSLVKHFHINQQQIILTPNAVEKTYARITDVKQKYGLNKFILFVSRFEPRKNHYLLLKSFVDLGLHREGYQLVFIGRRKDVKTVKYNNYFDQLPGDIKKAIIHLEDISPEELTGFYKQAELFVYPSLAEGFGIPPLEAAMLGCKVLCSDKTAMKDFDFFGKYLFDPGNPDELKSKILDALSMEQYPFAQIENAIHSRYNWQTIASDFGKKLKNWR